MRRRDIVAGASAAVLAGLSSPLRAAIVPPPPPAPPGGYPRPATYGLRLINDGATVQGRVTYSFGTCTSGSISGSVLTTAGSNGAGTLSGQFAVGQTVYASGVTTGTTITSLGTGTGGAGTYNLSGSPGNVSGVAIIGSTATITLTNASFVAGDVGKGIRLQGLGVNGIDLITTIAAVVSGTSVTLATPPVSPIPFGWSGGTAFVTVSYGTDNSATVKASHDAAVAAGSRHLWIDPGVYWVGTLTAGGNVIYIGENATFLGSRQYRVHSPTRRPPYTTRKSLNPAVHLAKFQAQASPRVAFVGDSIGTPDSVGNASIYIAQEIKKELRRSYPTKTISFFDFAIGGARLSDFSSASEIDFAGRGLTKPYWWQNGHPWIWQVLNSAVWGATTPPHTVLIEHGTNALTTGAEVAALYSAITQMAAWSTVPDVILLTPGTTSLQASAWWGESGMESREGIGAYWRGYCQRNNIGYLDIGRATRLLRDGIDIIAEDPQTIAPTGLIGALTLPVALPTCRDFAINWNMTVSNAQWIATGSALQIKIGDSIPLAYTTYFQIGRTVGGNFTVSLVQQGQGTVFGPIDTGVVVPVSGTIYFEFLIRDNSLRLATSNTNYGAVGLMPSIWEGEVERLRSPFAPIMCYNNAVATTVTTTQIDISVEQPVMPSMTDADLFGSSNPTVHPSTGGQVQVYRQALEQQRFS